MELGVTFFPDQSCQLTGEPGPVVGEKIRVSPKLAAGGTISRQNILVIKIVEDIHTVARERYIGVQLCIFTVSPLRTRNLQQAHQPRTPDTAHAQHIPKESSARRPKMASQKGKDQNSGNITIYLQQIPYPRFLNFVV